jgi:hypothetical protein
MNKASTSILVFGIYAFVAGLGFIFAPDMALGLLGLPTATDIWIRVVGILASMLGVYYVQAFRDNNTAFFAMTVWGRLIFSIALVSLALTVPNYLPLFVFAIVDALGACWTWYASRRELKQAIPIKV